MGWPQGLQGQRTYLLTSPSTCMSGLSSLGLALGLSYRAPVGVWGPRCSLMDPSVEDSPIPLLTLPAHRPPAPGPQAPAGVPAAWWLLGCQWPHWALQCPQRAWGLLWGGCHLPGPGEGPWRRGFGTSCWLGDTAPLRSPWSCGWVA